VNSQTLARNLKHIATTRHISQRQLGEWIGLSRSSMEDRLHGRTPFTIDQAITIARHLKIPLSELLGQDSTQ
jgi:transcriptional regulator with XRE-family HTH domain